MCGRVRLLDYSLLSFNQPGDLFCTDQEGATWLPNGNPFDELLHIQKGRHYGFPPRHPKHLPNVIDEPSVFDYGLQHQSTCGMNFNEPVNGGPVFGPDWWRGDALVIGESRGKPYRTKLVKTEAGYVAQNELLACMGTLAIGQWLPHVDLAVSRELTRASSSHEDFYGKLCARGTLTLETRLDVWQMLHPEVQKGSQRDYQYPTWTGVECGQSGDQG